MQARTEDDILFKQKLIDLGVAHDTYDFTAWPKGTLKIAYEAFTQQAKERSSPDHHTSLTLLSKAHIAFMGGEPTLSIEIQKNPLGHQDFLCPPLKFGEIDNIESFPDPIIQIKEVEESKLGDKNQQKNGARITCIRQGACEKERAYHSSLVAHLPQYVLKGEVAKIQGIFNLLSPQQIFLSYATPWQNKMNNITSRQKPFNQVTFKQ